jgi:hypothetical protein
LAVETAIHWNVNKGILDSERTSKEAMIHIVSNIGEFETLLAQAFSIQIHSAPTRPGKPFQFAEKKKIKKDN